MLFQRSEKPTKIACEVAVRLVLFERYFGSFFHVCTCIGMALPLSALNRR